MVDITSNEALAFLGISGASGWLGHELAHDYLAGGLFGQPEILTVSAALAALAFAGIWLLELDWHGEMPSLTSEVGKVGLIGSASFALAHDVTHGTFLGGVVQANLSQTSLILAAVAVVGMVAHEYLRDY